MCVAAWAYITAAVAMGTTAVLFVDSPGWEVPPALVGPLAYWIIICSVLGYYVVTWATQHLPASQVLCIPALRRLGRSVGRVLGVKPFLHELCLGRAARAMLAHTIASLRSGGLPPARLIKMQATQILFCACNGVASQ